MMEYISPAQIGDPKCSRCGSAAIEAARDDLEQLILDVADREEPSA